MHPKVRQLITHPDLILLKKPFFRGASSHQVDDNTDGEEKLANALIRPVLPRVYRTVVSQERFARELDPEAHDVIFDDNLPTICVKLRGKNGKNAGYAEIKHKRMGIPLQKRIREKQTLSLCGNPIQWTLRGAKPTQTDNDNFALFKEYWQDRNQDGMITKSVYHQLGYGDVGLLYYHNTNGEIKSRVLSYADGYVIISHADDNGEHILECVYYSTPDGVSHIDCYDDTYIYRFDNNCDTAPVTLESIISSGRMENPGNAPLDSLVSLKSISKHGFSESPLVTKRGDVAWNDVQSLIECFEILYNIYLVIQKRHGWGILYVKGKIEDRLQKIAGSIILNDRSLDGKGSAEFKTPPSPQGTLDTLQSIYEQIQIGSSTTFILPKDIKTGGDISAMAITLTQELDIEGATNKVIDWQNFLDKAKRLFIEGLAKELVNKNINPVAITDFARLSIGGKFKVWRPFNETEYNQMLCTLRGAGIISDKTAIEKNTVSQPDEFQRINAQQEAQQAAAQQAAMQATQQLSPQPPTPQQ